MRQDVIRNRPSHPLYPLSRRGAQRREGRSARDGEGFVGSSSLEGVLGQVGIEKAATWLKMRSVLIDPGMEMVSFPSPPYAMKIIGGDSGYVGAWFGNMRERFDTYPTK